MSYDSMRDELEKIALKPSTIVQGVTSGAMKRLMAGAARGPLTRGQSRLVAGAALTGLPATIRKETAILTKQLARKGGHAKALRSLSEFRASLPAKA
jgi:hypothetical protein